ncbi:MAG TPA: 50S ribosomal protein L30 [Clostridia bacterium]|nr:50S ribosomal protein L30 [Clostridia bacterium]
MARLKITLIKSLIGRPERQRATVKALGLNKLNSSVTRDKSSVVEGMVKKVEHLVEVEEC